ncbi:MAG: serine hydrolase [bacterium]|nr:serine hydrolase [bacterium]
MSEDQTLYDVVPEFFDDDPKKREITFRHLLTMKSGLGYSQDDFTEDLHQDRTRRQMRHILKQPLASAPGEEWVYKDCDPQLISGAIASATGKSMGEFADEVLFAPLGISNYVWEENVDGDNWGSQALYLRWRDLAKIGQLLADGGQWEGSQIVPESWIQQVSMEHAELPPPPPQFSRSGFGFLWWTMADHGAVFGRGTAGQYVGINPDLELVIVQTAEPYADEIGQYFQGPGPGSFLDLADAIVEAIEP